MMRHFINALFIMAGLTTVQAQTAHSLEEIEAQWPNVTIRDVNDDSLHIEVVDIRPDVASIGASFYKNLAWSIGDEKSLVTFAGSYLFKRNFKGIGIGHLLPSRFSIVVRLDEEDHLARLLVPEPQRPLICMIIAGLDVEVLVHLELAFAVTQNCSLWQCLQNTFRHCSLAPVVVNDAFSNCLIAVVAFNDFGRSLDKRITLGRLPGLSFRATAGQNGEQHDT